MPINNRHALTAQQARKQQEDPRLKPEANSNHNNNINCNTGSRLVVPVVGGSSCRPTTSCDSSVCPDPEPVPGFQPRSAWMAGQRGASASPTPSVVMAAAHQVGAPTRVCASTTVVCERRETRCCGCGTQRQVEMPALVPPQAALLKVCAVFTCHVLFYICDVCDVCAEGHICKAAP